ncbi:MAG: hypothetical protein WCT49_00950 [Candidatus Paceibacterota bacterium]|jgi:hypothetical protein|nr:hypothetical protein [Candidatus Paceibacterota bacterium]
MYLKESRMKPVERDIGRELCFWKALERASTIYFNQKTNEVFVRESGEKFAIKTDLLFLRLSVRDTKGALRDDLEKALRAFGLWVDVVEIQ